MDLKCAFEFLWWWCWCDSVVLVKTFLGGGSYSSSPCWLSSLISCSGSGALVGSGSGSAFGFGLCFGLGFEFRFGFGKRD